MTKRLGFVASRPFDSATEIDTEQSRQADDGWADLNQMMMLGVTVEELVVMAGEYDRRSVVPAPRTRKPKPKALADATTVKAVACVLETSDEQVLDLIRTGKLRNEAP